MTIQEIQERVLEIQKLSGDDEYQHSNEDKLMVDFIKEIASSNNDYSDQAKEILKTRVLAFSRWCA